MSHLRGTQATGMHAQRLRAHQRDATITGSGALGQSWRQLKRQARQMCAQGAGGHPVSPNWTTRGSPARPEAPAYWTRAYRPCPRTLATRKPLEPSGTHTASPTSAAEHRTRAQRRRSIPLATARLHSGGWRLGSGPCRRHWSAPDRSGATSSRPQAHAVELRADMAPPSAAAKGLMARYPQTVSFKPELQAFALSSIAEPRACGSNDESLFLGLGWVLGRQGHQAPVPA